MNVHALNIYISIHSRAFLIIKAIFQQPEILLFFQDYGATFTETVSDVYRITQRKFLIVTQLIQFVEI